MGEFLDKTKKPVNTRKQRQESQAADYRNEQKRMSGVFHTLFHTAEGEEVLKYLEDRYYHVPCFDHDVVNMTRNAANRDLVGHIRQLINQGVTTQ